jgi:hypothetical protein
VGVPHGGVTETLTFNQNPVTQRLDSVTDPETGTLSHHWLAGRNRRS